MLRVGFSSVRTLVVSQAAAPGILSAAASNAFRTASPNVLRAAAFRSSAHASRAFSTNFKRSTVETLKRTAVAPSAAFTRIFSRGITQIPLASQGFSWSRFAWTAGGVAAAVVVMEGVMNRETRDSLSPVERSYLHETFRYVGGGLTLTAIAARGLFTSGVAYRIMLANPWVVMGVGLAGSIGTMMGAMYTSPDNSVLKHAFWLGFQACQAATLSPLFFAFSPALMSRAALYTVGAVGSLSYIGATAKNNTYLYLGGPLLAGLTVVVLTSFAPMVLPLGVRSLAVMENVSLYGGLAVFSGLVLYDTQKILHNARLVEAGYIPRDAVKESISLELDFINLFIKILQLLAGNQNRK